MPERRCLGFGEFEGTCPNDPGDWPNAYWCERCDKLRIEYLDSQFAKISDLFEPVASSPSISQDTEQGDAEDAITRAKRDAARAVYLADHLLDMVPREVWRDQGGDDQQGHYEGDYWAEQTAAEIAALKATYPSLERQPAFVDESAEVMDRTMDYFDRQARGSSPASSPFQRVTDEATGGCGCACHTGTGYRSSCEHCSPAKERP